MRTVFTVFPQLAKFLSEGKCNQIKLFLKLSYFYVSRKIFASSKPFPITFIYNKTSFTFEFIYAEDVASLAQLYVSDEYEECPIANPSVIVDLGAHYGDSTLYYHARFPDAHIIAVEPSPESFKRLQDHTRNFHNITCVHAAIGATDGTVQLHMLDNSLGNSTRKRENAINKLDVPQRTLESLFAEHKITKADVIKFDIEGAESELFIDQNPNYFATFFIGEIHPELMEESEDVFLARFGAATMSKKSVGFKGRSIITALYRD